jgi:capsid portal protein
MPRSDTPIDVNEGFGSQVVEMRVLDLGPFPRPRPSRRGPIAGVRLPPQLLGIVPSNTGGFGAMLPAAQVFARHEIKPLQDRFKEVNEWIGEEVVRFPGYEVCATAEQAV